MENYTKILVFKNEVEARHLESILKEKDIPHIIKTYHDSAYDGLFQMQMGWGHIEAPLKYAKKIISIYEDLTGYEDV